MNAKAAEGGFCDWIKELIQKICRFFGLASEPETSIARANRLLEEKIAEGKQIIDRHMQQDPIANANASNQAIIIVIQYNGECKIDFGKAQNVKNNSEVAKAMVREVFNRHASAPNAKLEIDTILIRKNNVNDYDYQHFDNSINYADGRRGSGGGGSDGLGMARLGAILISAIPDRQHQRTIADFIRHQL
ncbi:MAG: hypothetical protein JSS60_07800 [Verrucomicrobia bacterium]|nr:hypothetical protein [Verrucomicrobiota bacterium]